MLVAVSSPLTRLIPGLMIWTIIFFLIVFFVLRKFAFARIQKIIDERREATRKEIAAETARALAQIRAEVADLTLEAAARVVGRTLDAKRDQELIEEAIAGLDFSRLEESA